MVWQNVLDGFVHIVIFSGFVEINKLLDYEEHRNVLVKKGNGVWFREAVQKIDEFIADPKAIVPCDCEFHER